VKKTLIEGLQETISPINEGGDINSFIKIEINPQLSDLVHRDVMASLRADGFVVGDTVVRGKIRPIDRYLNFLDPKSGAHLDLIWSISNRTNPKTEIYLGWFLYYHHVLGPEYGNGTIVINPSKPLDKIADNLMKAFLIKAKKQMK